MISSTKLFLNSYIIKKDIKVKQIYMIKLSINIDK